MGGCAVLPYGISVGFGGVAFVGIPSILWMLLVQLQHKIIPERFSQYGCGGYAFKFGVSFYYAFVWRLPEGFKAVSIDQNKRRSGT